MNKTVKNKKSTSVWTDKKTRDDLKVLAEKMGVPQGKCLALLIEEKNHREKVYNKKKRKEFEQLEVPDAINQINRRLEKIEKRENPRDTIVSFIRTQERVILKPMHEKIETLSSTLEAILDALNKLN